ncbi:bifunctional DNA primase/polymerase [Streptomyces sp. NPDC088785]|uniref:bifunctional DNA primase/polymerase n=1 Tax=Streptomyces sp. NPDC088785 TaxID=3365897 RepID=UPI00382C87FF
MREILGRRRRLLSRRDSGKSDLISAALTFATAWRWPVLPGIGLEAAGRRDGVRCACPDPECTVPGAHPFDPGLLAATTDARMVRWWWTNRPAAPIVLATGAPTGARGEPGARAGSGAGPDHGPDGGPAVGALEGRAPCAVSLPAVAGARALATLDRREIRLGPVIATPERLFILVAPYSLEQLGELLYAQDFVPGSLRFHGEGGYVALPPSRTGAGQVRWERAPLPGSAAPWVPGVEAVVDAVVDALTRTGVSAPEM